MSKAFFKIRDKKSYTRKLKNLEDKKPYKEPFIVFSLKYFDRNQGQEFGEWENDGLLSLALDRVNQLSQYTISQAIHNNILTLYTQIEFPANTTFVYPKHVPPNVTWASLHIQGKECVIGFVDDNIFHIVFLDRHHEFWISPKKNT